MDSEEEEEKEVKTASRSSKNSKNDVATKGKNRQEVDSEEEEKEELKMTSNSSKNSEKIDKSSLLIKAKVSDKLAKDILNEYNKLIEASIKVPAHKRTSKCMSGTGGYVSIVDLIAYQIGWGNRVIEWYESGINGQEITMPGDGFNKWQYTEMARHFYKKYQYDGDQKQFQTFHDVVKKIIEIVEKASKEKQLDAEGLWEWTKLQSGKYWPLRKWITVNTSAPYKRATNLIKTI